MPRKRSDGVQKKQTPSRVTKAGKSKITKSDVSVLDPKDPFPIVGIGASAGGLEAFEKFFTHTPPNTDMAFVLIQHLDPKHKSILTELIQRYTRMTVQQVEDGMAVEPNSVYVIPPNRNMALLHGNLHLLEQSEIHGVRTPIDFFFRSLAEDRKEKAICIVLSGTGTEGASGLRAIKGEGGMAMVHDPESAKYDGMPRNAVATGLVDYILAPDKMADQLIRYVRHSLDDVSPKTTDAANKDSGLLQKIFILVRSETGHDFSYYKQNTILHRIERRMAVNQITRLSDYVRYMQDDPKEAGILFKELLISVTNFFRDKEAFESLRDKAIPKLFENRSPDSPVRIWVPGCATGEEAYSIAVLCQDFIRTAGQNLAAQIFATDIDNHAIEVARVGLYPESIASDVPPEYLERFFRREDGSFRINKQIRDRVVFALQNVITDPPFSNIDLISCRNLLIYFGSELQKKVLPLFHYSLKKEGFLFLGTSETIGEFTDYFSVMDRKGKLYKRKDTDLAQRQVLDIHAPTATDRRVDAQMARHGPPMRGTNYREVAEKVIRESYGPTGVIVVGYGVVITFVEVTQRREIEEKLRQEISERERAEQKVQRSLDYAAGIVNTVREPLVVLDADLRVVSANSSFYRTFLVIPEETQGNPIYELGNRQWDIPRLRELLGEILPQQTEVSDYEVDHVFPEIGRKVMLLNARRIACKEEAEERKLILLAIEDRTSSVQGNKGR